jgi:transcription initiation factor TFIID subunit TAF12
MRAAVGTAVVAGTATAVSGRVRRRQDARYQTQAEAQAYEQQQYAQQQYAQPQYEAPPVAPPPAPAPAAAPAMSEVEQLKQLADLHAAGALTDEEFAAEKAKILAS